MSAEIIFLTLVLVAACSDLLTRKIPNPINFTLIISGIIAGIIGASQMTWSGSLLGVVTALAVLIVPFSLRVYQGGDVKLCMGIGAWLGVYGALWTIGLGAVGGGILALLMKLTAQRLGSNSRALTVPMAVSFSIAGVAVQQLGAPPW